MDNLDGLVKYAQAQRLADMGLCKCRGCKEEGDITSMVTVHFGGGLAYSLCVTCIRDGRRIMIGAGPLGIDIKQVG